MTSTRTSAIAHRSPSTPPPTASSPLSSNNCRATSPYVAPSARRIASSRERVDARSSSNPPTLTHAIASRSATAAPSAISTGRTSPSMACVKGMLFAPVIIVAPVRHFTGVCFTIAANSIRRRRCIGARGEPRDRDDREAARRSSTAASSPHRSESRALVVRRRRWCR